MNINDNSGSSNNSNIAYVVSMGKGLESFIYSEIDYLTSCGQKLILFATKYKKNDIFSPKSTWEFYHIQVSFQLLLTLIHFFLSPLSKPKEFFTALSTNSFIELFFALYYSPIMKRRGIKQIHAHFGDKKLFVAYYCHRILKLPLSVTIHSHELHYNPNPKLFEIAINTCSKIITISEFAKNILIERHKVPKDKIFVNHLFVDLKQFTPKQSIKILTVARFEPQKGFEYLLDALKLLSDLNVELIIVGWGPLDVQSLIEERNLAKRITIFNKLSSQQLRHLYQAADIYCLPSISHPTQGKEGIPVVLMEAMACGLPVVATNPGAVSEIVDEYLVPEKDPKKLAEALSELINDDEKRKIQGEKNRSLVEKKFSKTNADRLIEILSELNK